MQWTQREDGSWAFGLARLEPGATAWRVRALARFPQPPPGGLFQEGRTLWTVVADRVVAARSDLPVYQVMDAEGRPVREIRLPLTRRTLAQPEIDDQVRAYGALAGSLEVGEIALTNFLHPFGDSIFGLFQSGLWRAAEDPPLDGIVWRLISTSGRYMGVFDRSAGFEPMWFQGGRVWGVAPDSLGLPVIERRRLVPPPHLAR